MACSTKETLGKLGSCSVEFPCFLFVYIRNPQTVGSLLERFSTFGIHAAIHPYSPPKLHSSTMGKLYNHVDERERRLVKSMISAGIPWSQVHKVTGRSSGTIHAILKPRPRLCPKWAPAKLSASDVTHILKVAEAMIRKADGQKEITLPMIL